MFKALLRLFDTKAALALEAELEVKGSLFVGMDSQMAKDIDIMRKKYEKFQKVLQKVVQKVVQKGCEKMAQNKFSLDNPRTAVRTQNVVAMVADDYIKK
jgi:hypothetical protein